MPPLSTLNPSQDPLLAHRRYEACRILNESSIPCFVWFGDAIAHHCKSEFVSGLSLVVADIQAAKRVLEEKGWLDGVPAGSREPDRLLEQATTYNYVRLAPPGTKPTDKHLDEMISWPPVDEAHKPIPTPITLLLPAEEWNVPLASLLASAPGEIYPPLALYANAMIASHMQALDGSSMKCFVGEGVFLLYMGNPTLNRKEFACNLEAENRPYHFGLRPWPPQ